MVKTPETVYGWNIWSSNPPKDYLTKFAAKAGSSPQVIIIDDILPKVLKNRDLDSQDRRTDLYLRFFDQLGSVMKLNKLEVHQLSNMASASDLLNVASEMTLSEAVEAMPANKRVQYRNLSLVELFHSAAEVLAYKIMVRLGATKILRGSGQVGLVNLAKHYLGNQATFEFIDASQDYKTTLSEYLDTPSIVEIEKLMDIWAKAGLLSEHTQVDKSKEFISTIPEKYGEVLLMIENFFRLAQASLAITGSAANETLDPNQSDLDLVVFSEELLIPSVFSTTKVPPEVKNAYRDGSMPIVSIKAKINGISTSIKFIKPQIAMRYWEEQETFTYWREHPESAGGGKDHHIYLDATGQPYTFFFNEKPFLTGGSVYQQKRYNENGTPLLDHNVHMILTMRLITDNLCISGIKLKLIEKILEYKAPEEICELLKFRKDISPNIAEEVAAIIKIIKS